MLPACLVALVAAAEPVKLAAPGLSYVGVEPAMGEVLFERFVSVLSEQGGLVVTTTKDLNQMLGLQRQQQLLGCAQEGSESCMAELAGALGADAILSGSIAKSGGTYLVNLRVLHARDGRALVNASGRLESDKALTEWLDAQARAFPARIIDALGVGGASRIVPWVPAIAGVVLAITGGVLFGLSKNDAAVLRTPHLTEMQIDSAAGGGRTKETAGLVLLGLGGAAAVASIVWFIASRISQPVAVSLWLLPGGTTVGLAGAWP